MVTRAGSNPSALMTVSKSYSVPLPATKAIWRHGSIPDRRLDIAMSQVGLQGPCILALVGVLEAARVPEHVRVDRKGHARPLAKPRHHLAEPRCRYRAGALG